MNLCPKILVIHTPCCTDGSMHPTLRPVILRNWDLANSWCSGVARLKVSRFLAVPVQVWQDVEAHHDILQQLLYLLVRLLYRDWGLREWDWLQAIVLVWGEAVTGERLGVRGGVGVRGWFWGAGGSRLKNLLMNWAWLDGGRRRLTICKVCLWPFVVGAIL